MQTKLAIHKPGDEYEQEADRISERVMRIPELPRQLPYTYDRGLLSPTVLGYGRLNTKRVESSNWEQSEVPPIIQEVLHSPGQPLDLATRAFMEPRLGHDFSHVRVHTDEKAVNSARALNALAFTVGHHLVFGVGQYEPTTASGRHLISHELIHSIQQGFAANPFPQVAGGPSSKLQRQEAPGSPEETSTRSAVSGHEGDDLRNKIFALVEKKVSTYAPYRDLISKSTPIEKRVALNSYLLSLLNDTLDFLSFARCVEALGRKAPTFDELRKDSAVLQAIDSAWLASDVGVRDLVTQPHEEGGWVFMNLIDGSLTIERATPQFTDALRVEPAPQVRGSVLVALFHTHPALGPKAGPSPQDLKADKRRGVPNLVAANKRNKNPETFQIYLSGPAAREHLASDTQFPGPSGGIAP